MEIFNSFTGDISWVTYRYFIGFLEIFHRFPVDIHRLPGDI